MIAAVQSMPALNGSHKKEMKDYLDSFFERIATPEAIMKTFVNGCPARRGRV